jgi:hypothetical protein
MKNLLAAAVILSLTVSSCSKTESLEGTQVESQSRAHKGGGSGGGSTTVAQVTGLTANALSATEIYLTWNGVPEATEYWIFRNGAVVGIVVYPTSYTDNNSLTPGTTYNYEVAASVKGVLGLKSTTVTVTTP